MIRRKISPGFASLGSPGGYQKKSFSDAQHPSINPKPSGTENESPPPASHVSPTGPLDVQYSTSLPSFQFGSPLQQRSNKQRRSGVQSPPLSPGSRSSPTSPGGDRWPNCMDEYKIEDVIGFGASAVVHSGYCIPRQEKCAIKRINLEQTKTSMEEILKEIQAMVSCSNENVVNYFTSFVVGEELWIVMRLHEGGSLLDLIKQTMRVKDTTHGVLDEETIATVTKEVLKGLAYLHKSGQIHRDIKAGNILLSKDGSVQIGDFGVSASLGGGGSGVGSGGTDGGRKHTFVGTPCWMSPEVVQSNGVGYDCKTDIWSLGITVIEMVRGSAPYMNFPPIKILMLVMQDEAPKLETGAGEREDYTKNYGKSIRSFISLCLTKDPAKRSSATELLKHPFIKKARDKDFLSTKFTFPPDTPKQVKVRKSGGGGRRTAEIIPSAEWEWNQNTLEKSDTNTNQFHS